jgi:translocation and assembly module TamA
VEGRLGLVERSFNTNYSIPRERPGYEWLNFNAGVRQQVVDSFDTVTTSIGLNESKYRPFGIREFRYVDFKRDDFDVASQSGTTALLIPGVRWSLRRTDDPVNVSRGFDVSLDLRAASRDVLSDVSLFRAQFDAAGVRALPLGFRFLGRASLGGLISDDFLALPPAQRFFAGGDASVRGYAFQSLGPVNDTGSVVGGSLLGVASAELERFLTRKWGVAAFVDAGNAFAGAGSTTSLAIGIGLGVRWRSPIGPVKVDFAHPLEDGEEDLRLHVRIGPDF